MAQRDYTLNFLSPENNRNVDQQTETKEHLQSIRKKYTTGLNFLRPYYYAKCKELDHLSFFQSLRTDQQERLMHNQISTGDFYAKARAEIHHILDIHIDPNLENAQLAEIIRGLTREMHAIDDKIERFTITTGMSNGTTEAFYTNTQRKVCIFKDLELGKGHSGIVWQGEMQNNEGVIPVAVKWVENKQNYLLELHNLTFRGNSNTAEQKLLGFNEQLNYFVFSLVNGGNLQQALLNGSISKLNELEKFNFCIELSHCLLHLHLKWLLHLDLYPKNILIHDGKPQIADFGVSTYRTTSPLLPRKYLHDLPLFTGIRGASFGIDVFLLISIIVQIFEGRYIKESELIFASKYRGTALTQIHNYPWLESLFYQDWDHPTRIMHNVMHVFFTLENARPLQATEGPDIQTLNDLKSTLPSQHLISKLWRLPRSILSNKEVVEFLTLFVFMDLPLTAVYAALYQLQSSPAQQTLLNIIDGFQAVPSELLEVEKQDVFLNGLHFLLSGFKSTFYVLPTELSFKTFRKIALKLLHESLNVSQLIENINNLIGVSVFNPTVRQSEKLAEVTMTLIKQLYESNENELLQDLPILFNFVHKNHSDTYNKLIEQNAAAETQHIHIFCLHMLALFPCTEHILEAIEKDLLFPESVSKIIVLAAMKALLKSTSCANNPSFSQRACESAYHLLFHCKLQSLKAEALQTAVSIIADFPNLYESEKVEKISKMCADAEKLVENYGRFDPLEVAILKHKFQ